MLPIWELIPQKALKTERTVKAFQQKPGLEPLLRPMLSLRFVLGTVFFPLPFFFLWLSFSAGWCRYLNGQILCQSSRHIATTMWVFTNEGALFDYKERTCAGSSSLARENTHFIVLLLALYLDILFMLKSVFFDNLVKNGLFVHLSLCWSL